MAVILFVSIIAVNSILFFTNKNSKSILFVSLLILGLLMAFSSVEVGSGDSYYYFLEYNDNSLLINSGEKSFNFLMSFFSGAGISFQWFRFIIFIIGLFLLGYTIVKHTNSFSLAIVLYAISVYYFLCVSLNYFLALSIVVFATTFLERKRIIVFLVLVLLATTIHQSMFISLFFLVTIFRRRNKCHKYLFLFYLTFVEFGFLLIMSIFTPIIPWFTNTVYNLIVPIFNKNSSYLGEYLIVGYSRTSMLYALFYLICIIISRIAFNHISCSSFYSLEQKNISDYSYLIALLCSIFMPFLIITPTMVRMLFPGLIFMFYLFSVCFSSNDGFILFFKRNSNHYVSAKKRDIYLSRYLFGVLVLVSSGLWMVFYFRHELSFDLFKFLEGNSLF